MSLSHEDLALAGEAIMGRPLICPSDTMLLHTRPDFVARLTILHAQSIQAARQGPSLMAVPAVAKALEHELVHAMVSCLADDKAVESRAAPLRHARMFVRFLEARRDEPVYLAEICAASVYRNACCEAAAGRMFWASVRCAICGFVACISRVRRCGMPIPRQRP